MWTLSRVVFASKDPISKDPISKDHKKKQMIRKLRWRQRGIEERSLRVLEHLNHCESVSERHRLSLDLNYLCKHVLDIQDQIDNIDVFLLLTETESESLDL